MIPEMMPIIIAASAHNNNNYANTAIHTVNYSICSGPWCYALIGLSGCIFLLILIVIVYMCNKEFGR